MRTHRREGPHRVAVVGLGKQGLLLVERLSRRSDTELVAVVDVSPDKVGRPLDEVAERATGFDLRVEGSLDAVQGADVALVATSSRIAAVGAQIEELVALGVDVVTTSEELAYPWRQFPAESRRIDEAAQRHGVSVVGCGSNPGFLMDLVPIVLSFGCERVDGITIRRSLDMRPHRPERLTRFALGMTPEEFATVDQSVLVGHVGFTQSIHCVADALGWELDETREEPVRPVVVTDERRAGDHVELAPGTVAVIEHSAWGSRDGERVIDLSMFFGFHDADDPVPHGDTYEIRASDQTIRLEAAPSWSPFTATPSTVVNMIGPIRDAPAGLRCVTDFPAAALATAGAHVDASDAPSARNYLATLAEAR
ncbi:MAG TPA: hypothetical protein VFR97_10210 [Capillimicrobium sp.]|nr:hypothetical protein [Capillimicrobium sp.]